MFFFLLLFLDVFIWFDILMQSWFCSHNILWFLELLPNRLYVFLCGAIVNFNVPIIQFGLIWGIQKLLICMVSWKTTFDMQELNAMLLMNEEFELTVMDRASDSFWFIPWEHQNAGITLLSFSRFIVWNIALM